MTVWIAPAGLVPADAFERCRNDTGLFCFCEGETRLPAWLAALPVYKDYRHPGQAGPLRVRGRPACGVWLSTPAVMVVQPLGWWWQYAHPAEDPE